MPASSCPAFFGTADPSLGLGPGLGLGLSPPQQLRLAQALLSLLDGWRSSCLLVPTQPVLETRVAVFRTGSPGGLTSAHLHVPRVR